MAKPPSVAPKFRSKTQILLRETWRRALMRGPEGHLRIVFKTESHAHKARMDLYKAVQPEKQGKGTDLELIEAAQSLEIVLAPGEPNVLIMRHRGQNDIYSALQEATGLNLATLVDPELDKDMQESFAQLAKRGVKVEGITASPAAPAPTPAPAVVAGPADESTAFRRDLEHLNLEHLPNPFFDRSKK